MTSGTHRRSRADSGEEPLHRDLLRALCHEVGNLLAAIRLSAHLLPTGSAEAERTAACRDIENLAALAGALLAQVRPLLAGASVVRVRVSPAEVLRALARELKDRNIGDTALSIAAGRSLPDVRVDPDALYHLLLTLVQGSLEAVAPGGRVRVLAKHRGRRVILSVSDDGDQLDLDEIRRGSMPRGRELVVRVADAVLRLMGGRASAEPQRRGTRVDLFLPAVAQKKP